ncbi:hypothetical protein V1292_000699 [Bradyrhizobium sp. AZCC 1719]
MLRPDGADLFIGCELTACGFGQRSIKIGSFLGCELIRRLVHACELQQNSREIVLRLIWQSGNGLDGLFEQAGHAATIKRVMLQL